MPQAEAHYVEGQKLEYPHGKRLVSGPFDTSGEAWAEVERLRPLYPDANLSAVLYRGKSLPERRPRGSRAAYDLSTAEGRLATARAIADHALHFGAVVSVENWDGEPDVDVTVPGGLASIWLGWTPDAPMPLISWVAAGERKLRASVAGAWHDGPQNVPSRKRTSLPADWPEFFAMLEAGLCALVDGSAFDKE